MDSTLQATLSRTRAGEPLATVDGLPGGSADLTPAELRALAAALVKIAADCEARPVSTKRPFPPARKEYRISWSL
jgi:hypothetical protein